MQVQHVKKTHLKVWQSQQNTFDFQKCPPETKTPNNSLVYYKTEKNV